MDHGDDIAEVVGHSVSGRSDTEESDFILIKAEPHDDVDNSPMMMDLGSSEVDLQPVAEGLAAPVEDLIEQALPNLTGNVMEKLKSALCALGVEDVSDLSFVEERDLLSVLKPIQARRLMASWGRKPDDIVKVEINGESSSKVVTSEDGETFSGDVNQGDCTSIKREVPENDLPHDDALRNLRSSTDVIQDGSAPEDASTGNARASRQDAGPEGSDNPVVSGLPPISPCKLCTFCNHVVPNLTEHIEMEHFDIKRVASIRRLPRKRRLTAFKTFEKEGVLKLGKCQGFGGQAKKVPPTTLVLCERCMRFYSRISIGGHSRRCVGMRQPSTVNCVVRENCPKSSNSHPSIDNTTAVTSSSDAPFPIALHTYVETVTSSDIPNWSELMADLDEEHLQITGLKNEPVEATCIESVGSIVDSCDVPPGGMQSSELRYLRENDPRTKDGTSSEFPEGESHSTASSEGPSKRLWEDHVSSTSAGRSDTNDRSSDLFMSTYDICKSILTWDRSARTTQLPTAQVPSATLFIRHRPGDHQTTHDRNASTRPSVDTQDRFSDSENGGGSINCEGMEETVEPNETSHKSKSSVRNRKKLKRRPERGRKGTSTSKKRKKKNKGKGRRSSGRLGRKKSRNISGKHSPSDHSNCNAELASEGGTHDEQTGDSIDGSGAGDCSNSDNIRPAEFEQMPDDEQQSSGAAKERSPRKAQYVKPERPCLFCNGTYVKLSRHIEHVHRHNPRVVAALKCPEQQRIAAFDLFKKEGIAKYNAEQAKLSSPSFQREKNTTSNDPLVMCQLCKGYFSQRFFHGHTEKCEKESGRLLAMLHRKEAETLREQKLIEENIQQEQELIEENIQSIDPFQMVENDEKCNNPIEIPCDEEQSVSRKRPKRLCIFCNKMSCKLSWHIKMMHGRVLRVAAALRLAPDECLAAFNVFRKEGILRFNKKQRLLKRPTFQTERYSSRKRSVMTCNMCKGFFNKRFLTEHRRKCPMRFRVEDSSAKNAPEGTEGLDGRKPKRMCIFCSKMQAKLNRHLMVIHRDEVRVAAAIKLTGKRRNVAFMRFRNEGILLLKERRGEQPRPTKARTTVRSSGITMCSLCKGVFRKGYFKRHFTNCHSEENVSHESVKEVPPGLICEAEKPRRGRPRGKRKKDKDLGNQGGSKGVKAEENKNTKGPVEDSSAKNAPEGAGGPDGRKPKRMCIFCNKMQAKLNRHLMQMHRGEARVAAAMELTSKRRKVAFDRFRNEGILLLKESRGEQPGPTKARATVRPRGIVMCSLCKGVFRRDYFKRHFANCHSEEGVSLESVKEDPPGLAPAERPRRGRPRRKRDANSELEDRRGAGGQRVPNGDVKNEAKGKKKKNTRRPVEGQDEVYCPTAATSCENHTDAEFLPRRSPRRFPAVTSCAERASQNRTGVPNKRKLKGMCIFCSKMQEQLTRHLMLIHRDETRVAAVMKLTGERRGLAFRMLRNEGILLFKKSRGEQQRPAEARAIIQPSGIVMCILCRGIFRKMTFKRHFINCHSKEGVGQRGVEEDPPGLTRVTEVPRRGSLRGKRKTDSDTGETHFSLEQDSQKSQNVPNGDVRKEAIVEEEKNTEESTEGQDEEDCLTETTSCEKDTYAKDLRNRCPREVRVVLVNSCGIINAPQDCTGMPYKGKPERMCIFCNEMQTQLERHLMLNHPEEARVTEAMKLSGRSREVAFKKFRNEGVRLLRKRRREQLKPAKARAIIQPSGIVMCSLCRGVFRKMHFKRHSTNCHSDKVVSHQSVNKDPPSLGCSAETPRRGRPKRKRQTHSELEDQSGAEAQRVPNDVENGAKAREKKNSERPIECQNEENCSTAATSCDSNTDAEFMHRRSSRHSCARHSYRGVSLLSVKYPSGDVGNLSKDEVAGSTGRPVVGQNSRNEKYCSTKEAASLNSVDDDLPGPTCLAEEPKNGRREWETQANHDPEDTCISSEEDVCEGSISGTFEGNPSVLSGNSMRTANGNEAKEDEEGIEGFVEGFDEEIWGTGSTTLNDLLDAESILHSMIS